MTHRNNSSYITTQLANTHGSCQAFSLHELPQHRQFLTRPCRPNMLSNEGTLKLTRLL